MDSETKEYLDNRHRTVLQRLKDLGTTVDKGFFDFHKRICQKLDSDLGEISQSLGNLHQTMDKGFAELTKLIEKKINNKKLK